MFSTERAENQTYSITVLVHSNAKEPLDSCGLGTWFLLSPHGHMCGTHAGAWHSPGSAGHSPCGEMLWAAAQAVTASQPLNECWLAFLVWCQCWIPLTTESLSSPGDDQNGNDDEGDKGLSQSTVVVLRIKRSE